MLHPNAKQRLRRVIYDDPETDQGYPIGWRSPRTGNYLETTIYPDIRWKDDDIPLDYPLIAMELSPEAVPRRGFLGQEGDDTYYEDKPDDPEIAHIKYSAKPLYARLRMTVAVDKAMQVDGEMIPKHVVADMIAQEAYYRFQFDSDHLNTQGTTADGEFVPYEWPMAVYQERDHGVTNMNRYIDEQQIQRRNLQFRVDYSYYRAEEIEATDQIVYEIGIDHNFDMEIKEEDGEEWYGPYHVDVSAD